MKTNFLLIITSLVVLCGCKTYLKNPAPRQTIAQVQNSVDSAYKAYLDLAVKGRASTRRTSTINSDYKQFTASATTEKGLAHGNVNAPASAELSNAGTKIIAAIAESREGR